MNANKGSISGLVFDSIHDPIPNALVTVTGNQTGMEWRAHTDQQGIYRFGPIDAGSYRLTVEAGSFEAGIKNITIDVGSSVQVDITLAAGSAPEHVNLSASFVTITDSTTTQVFPLEAIRDLPIDGRRFQDFATLAPTVQSNAVTQNELSFLGQREVYGNIMIDGTDYNEPFLGGIRGGTQAQFTFTVPQSAIQEFQVITSGYSAEYGRSTSGILNAITRSGTNQTHGEAFYQFRDHALGLRNPFGVDPIEDQHQMGASAGGPLRKDRLFWFGALEGQLASFPRTVSFSELDSVAGNITPNIEPAYNYFRSLQGPYTQSNNTLAGFARLDYQNSNASRLTARFSGSLNDAKNAVSTGPSWATQTDSALSNNGTVRDNTRTAAAQYTSVLSATTINDLRFEYSAEDFANKANSAQPLVEAGVIGSYGTGLNLPATTDDYRVQFADALTIQRGQHNIVAGADYSLLRATQLNGSNQYGSFVIPGSNVADILAILSASGNGSNRFDDPSVVYWRQVGNTALNAQAHEIGLFAQDNWRVSPTLTANFGLRWEAQLNPSPLDTNSFLVDNVRDFPFPLGRLDPTEVRSQLGQWAPRASLAWNVTGSGRTVVRAGAGLFYGQTPLGFYAAALNDFGAAGGNLSLEIGPSNGATVYQQFARAGFNLNQSPLSQLPILSVVDVWEGIAGKPNQFAQSSVFTTSGDSFRNPRSLQLSLGIEHQLGKGVIISYQLNQLNAVHLPRVVDFNVPEPFIRPGDLSERPFFGLRSGTPRPNPNLGAVYVLDSSARSTFLGNTFRVAYRSKLVDLAAHYTLSFNRSDDDLEWPFVTTTYQNPFNLKEEWGWSSMDARNEAAGYALFHAPKGIEITTLFEARSGLPIDATTGDDTSELLATSLGNRPLAAPGVPFPRNAFRNLDFKSVDLRVLKAFRLSETFKLELSAEAFNLFNFNNVAFLPNYESPNNPAFIYGLGISTSGQVLPPNPGFLQQRVNGQYNAATMYQEGTPLQAQLGVRLFF
ncbi:MAG: carboxypeptidase regulatory-like domain-containing protein [Bryobacteraceae bacterium]